MTVRHHVEVSVLNLQSERVEVDRLVSVAKEAIESEGGTGELSIVLVDEADMKKMNSQYRRQCEPTDVLSFSIDGLITEDEADPQGPPLVIGEVIICPAIAAKQATKGLDSEMALLVAHGVLHILGYDHVDQQSASVMRGRELDLTGLGGASAT